MLSDGEPSDTYLKVSREIQICSQSENMFALIYDKIA